MATSSTASTVVVDGSASGLPPLTGYRPDEIDERIAAALSADTATGGPRELLDWIGSLTRGTALRAVLDVDVLVNFSRWQQVMEPTALIRALGHLSRATADTAHSPLLWTDLIEAAREERPTSEQVQASDLSPESSALLGPHLRTPQVRASAPTVAEPHHARLAREVREITRLSTSVLAASMGVTREQYSRWISGRAISPMRHGQLQYLHTIIRDLLRRLGDEQAVVWLQTPLGDDGSPAAMLARRRLDLVHRAVVALPDSQPVRDDTIVALAAPMDDTADSDAQDDEGEPWTPYGSSRRNEDGGSAAAP